MREVRLVATLIVISAIAACAAPAPATDSSELAATTEAWLSAFNAGDLDALTGLYAADAMLLPPNAAMERGSTAVRSAFEEMVAAKLQAGFEILEVAVSGELGQKVGLYTVLAPDGSTVETGKFVELWRKVEGQWRLTTDIWNSDQAATHEGQLLVITHEVADADRWLSAWTGPESRHEMFAGHGAPHVGVVQSTDDPNRTGLVVYVTDMDAFQAFLESPEGQAAKAEDGVKERTMRVFAGVQ